MNLNHLNLTVTDVRGAAAFLERYCGLRQVSGNAGMAFLSDDNEFVLTLMKHARSDQGTYPATFHIGFFVDSQTTVDAINQRLQEDGYPVAAPEHHHAYTFYVEAPGGFTVEIGC